MSDEIKLKWETITRWILRIAIGLMSIVFAVSGNAMVTIFAEMRSDVKQLLHNQPILEGRVKAMEDRTTRVENDINQLREFSNK